MKRPLLTCLLLTLACDANVVDAVREPMPLSPSAGAASGGSAGSVGAGEGGSGETGTMGGEGGSAEAPPTSPLVAALFHRYSFDGDGDFARDSIGAAHGQVVNTTLAGDGTLPLAGGDTAQYVNLPNYLVSGLTDATFESWLTWHGGGPWQRIFDFGSNTADVEDMQGPLGRSYLFLTPFAAADSNRQLPAGMRVAYSQKGVQDEEVCLAPKNVYLPAETPVHVAVVVDSKAQTMSLYQDGALVVECPLTRPLSAINDENNWLGRSNFRDDVELAATYDEFRMYKAALSAELIAESFAAGPDAILTP